MKKTIAFLAILSSLVIFYSLRIKQTDITMLMYNLAIAFIMSLIFYLLVEYYPRRKLRNTGFILIQNEYTSLYNHIYQILEVTKKYFNIEKPLEEMVERDWTSISGIVVPNDLLVLSEKKEKNKKLKIKTQVPVPAGGTRPLSLDNYIKYCIKVIQRNLKVIKSYENYYSSDNDFLKCFLRIENSAFITHYEKGTPCFLYGDAAKNIYELQKIYFELKKFQVHYYDTQVIIDTSTAAMEYKDKYIANTLMTDWNNFQKRKIKLYLLTYRIIFHDSSLDSKTIVEWVNRSLMADTKLLTNSIQMKEKYDLEVYIISFFQLSYLKKIRQSPSALKIVIVRIPILSRIVEKYLQRVGWKDTFFTTVPSRFKLLKWDINKEEPSRLSMDRITSFIDKKFNDKNNLHF